jgi:predicted metalloprotease
MRFGRSGGDRTHVEDRRGSGLGGAGMKLGVGGTLVLVVLSLVFQQDLFSMLGASSEVGGGAPLPAEEVERRQAGEADLERVAVGAFNDAQELWASSLRDYRPAKLVLFWDAARSGCGAAGAEVGPFYCPADERVYIDLGFYRELAARFGAPGEFAQAYVIAHEVGHHLQHVLGIERRVREAQARDPSSRNPLSVRMELQADCLAGVWGQSAQQRGLLDPGEIEQGLRAAAAVGDDRLQGKTGGRVNPETFTHGTAEQRASWFRRGLEAGDLDACDTFARGAE